MGKRSIRVLEILASTKLEQIGLFLRERNHIVVSLQQMPQTRESALSGIGVEGARDGDIGVSQLATSGVNAVSRADLAPEFLPKGMQRFVGFDSVFAQPADQPIEHILTTVMPIVGTRLGLVVRFDHK